MPEIQLTNLRKCYGDLTVIEDLNLSMSDGEFTVLVGPSGCGKSTTLRMIAGLENISGGMISIDGRDVSYLDPKDRDLAMVFQDYALYPHMNVAKNMSFALRLARMPRAQIRKRVEEVAEKLDLSAYLNRKPAELSGGQRQRVAMGRALVRDAGTFLFDEPLSNLDAKLRGKMRAELAIMSKEIQKNMIYVTHDQIEAMTLGDRIVVMKDGHIMQVGTPETLYRRPANKFVAGFIGSPTMNFLTLDVQEINNVMYVVSKDFMIAVPADRAASLRKTNLQKVLVGLRPNSFQESEAADCLRLPILLSEYIGAQSVLTSVLNDARLTIEINTVSPIAAGTTRGFQVNSDEMHFFNPETDAAI